MALYNLSRKIRMGILNQEADVCELLFINKRAQRACRLFLTEVKAKNGVTRNEFSRFANNLDAGQIEQGFRYSRRQFYAQIRRVLLTLGLLGIQQRPVEAGAADLSPERRRRIRDVVDKYVAVKQPIARGLLTASTL